jgi:hypothetical protein
MYSRYVSYTVSLQYQGREVSYDAVALFTNDSKPYLVDRYLQGINDMVGKEVFPMMYFVGVGTEPRAHPQPALSEWIRNLKTDAACKPGSSCCDSQTLRCSLAPSDLELYQATHPISQLSPSVQPRRWEV